MFKTISDILSKFTPRQRIVALLLLLFSITLISVGPQLIDSWKGGVPDEYKEVIETQNQQIRDLQIELGELNIKLVSSFQECTDRVVQREKEIALLINDIIQSNANNIVAYSAMMVDEDNSYQSYDDLPIYFDPTEELVGSLEALTSDLLDDSENN